MRTRKALCHLVSVLTVVGVMATGVEAQAQITLSFDSLPSAQGWTYPNLGAPETEVFSVSDGVLTQNSLADPYIAPLYQLEDLVDPYRSFSVYVRARVLGQTGSSHPFGFGFSVQTDEQAFGIGLGTTRISDIHGNVLSTSIDTAQFHDYFLEATPFDGYRFYVDGELIGTGPPRYEAMDNRVYLGDLTRGTGAYAEITAYTFSQPIIAVCSGFRPPVASGSVTVRGPRALPLRAQLFDAEGNEMTDLELTAPPVLQVIFTPAGGEAAIDVTDDALPVGFGTEGNEFEYNLADQVWQYNLKTKDYTAAGTYTITMVSGDETEYLIEPPCEAVFERPE